MDIGFLYSFACLFMDSVMVRIIITSYHGFAMGKVSVNSTSLYETN